MPRRYRTIDAHAGGQPLRLVVEGLPAPRGTSMREKQAWVKRHADRVRRTLMREPRGHVDMHGAVLTEPATPGADAGLLVMHHDGYSPMGGHAIIAVTTIAVERGLILPRGEPPQVVYDTPAGVVVARARLGPARAADGGPRVEAVAYLGVPSFVLHAGVVVRAGARDLRADVAFGGVFYAIVDAEAAGLPLDAARLPELRRLGVEIRREVESAVPVTHPIDPALGGLHGTIFTSPPGRVDADLRILGVYGDGRINRSPGGTGTAAVMAVLDAMGLLAPGQRLSHEGLAGTLFRGRVAERTEVGEVHAIVPEIEGSAWITGEHTFIVEDDDPMGQG